jgi:hypothetical protein
MVREDRSTSGKRSISPISMRRHAAVAVFGFSTLLTGSRADDGVTAPPRDESARNANARLPSIESLLPELSLLASGSGDGYRSAPTPRAAAPHAVARLVGTAAPGLRVTLDDSASTGQPLWYRWVQVQGPPTPLNTDNQPAATLTVPAKASSLAYLLLVGNGAGADVADLTVPVESKGQSVQSAGLRADAGDDQIGQVGRQVTLNGLRSVPRDRLGYRWIQMAGPKVSLKIEDGYIFTFVPPASGLHQFALVVASGSEISDPDLVNLAVGVPLPPPAEEPAPAPASLKDLARAALSGIDGGPSAAGDLADAFEEVAARMDLYTSYAELMIKLTRRLEEIVPADARPGLSACLPRSRCPLSIRCAPKSSTCRVPTDRLPR